MQFCITYPAGDISTADNRKGQSCLKNISILDVKLIRDHIDYRGFRLTKSQLVTADVDQSGVVDINDANQLEQSLHTQNFIPNCTYLSKPYRDRHITVGDVSSFLEVKDKDRINVINLRLGDQIFDAGDNIQLSFKLEEHISISAFQINFEYLHEYLDLDQEQIFKNIKVQKYGRKSIISLLYTKNQVDAEIEDNLFTLGFKALKKGRLSDVLTEANQRLQGLLYDVDYNQYFLDFAYIDRIAPLKTHTPAPNPFKDHTTINFELSNDMPLEVSIYDHMGRKVYTHFEEYHAGFNALEVNESQLINGSGIYYLHLSGGEFKEVTKLFMID